MFTNSGINKVFLIGSIASEPKQLSFTDEEEVLSFELITKELIKKNGEDVEMLEYHNIKVPIEILAADKQLQQGDLLYLEGKIKTRSFFDEQQIKKYKLEIIAAKYQVLSESLRIAV